jgi:hypothetical protein
MEGPGSILLVKTITKKQVISLSGESLLHKMNCPVKSRSCQVAVLAEHNFVSKLFSEENND